jgi:hypothetical protein
MKSNTGAESTLLVLVVDRSGSMESIREDMEGGIKTLLAEQAEEPGSCLVTLAQFDTSTSSSPTKCRWPNSAPTASFPGDRLLSPMPSVAPSAMCGLELKHST